MEKRIQKEGVVMKKLLAVELKNGKSSGCL